jgi:Undecaprenyl-phosphate galactose phosphotransferase WbaP
MSEAEIRTRNDFQTSVRYLESVQAALNQRLSGLSPLISVMSDAVAILVGLFVITPLFTPFGYHTASITHAQIVLLIGVLCGGFAIRGHYNDRRDFSADVTEITVGVAAAGLLLSTSIESTTPWVPIAFLLVMARFAMKWLMFQVSDARLPALLIGPQTYCAALRSALDGNWYRGFKVREEIICDTLRFEDVEPVLVGLAHAGSIGLVVLPVEAPSDEVAKVRSLANRLGMALSLSYAPHRQFVVDHFFGTEVTMLREVPSWGSWMHKYTKRLFDLTLSILGLACISPILLIICLLVSKDRGPVIYASPRIGCGGRTFRAFKFRTMVMNADQVLQDLLERDPAARHEWETTFKLQKDPRITPIGHVLRRFSLDELPQVINVIRGEMSLVGPRPLLLAEREKYGEAFGLYCKCVPGITGPWQVSGRNNLEYQRRIELNSWYANHATIWTDILILIRTFTSVVTAKGAV